jgi:hypothetical protein
MPIGVRKNDELEAFFAMEQPGSICAARIWFHFVERVTGNHIDEWLLIR